VFVFEAAHAFSLNVMYLVFGYRYQKCIKMTGLPLAWGWTSVMEKLFFLAFYMLDHRLNLLDLQKAFKNYICILFSFSSHSFRFTFISLSIQLNCNNSNSTITITTAQPTRMTIVTSLSSHSFVIDFSITIEKRRTRTTLITTINNPKTKIQILFHSDTKATIFNWLVWLIDWSARIVLLS